MNLDQTSDNLIKQIQMNLTDDVLSPKYRKILRKTPLEGHCYVAAEALYHLMGGSAAKLTAFVASYEEDGQKFTHWWLRNSRGNILDPTASQYLDIGQEPPYSKGKAIGFLTKAPSARAQIVINKVNKALGGAQT